jgi:hypothetical protein
MKVLTYRGKERITQEQAKQIRLFFGDEKRCPYHWFQEKEIDQNFGTFSHELVDLFTIIQCDRQLNEREAQIRERIKKGITPSRSRHYSSVEEGLVDKLLIDALRLAEREGMKINIYGYWNEVERFFGLPLSKTAIEKDLEKAIEKTTGIPKPKRFHKWTAAGHLSYDQDSTYKRYYVKVKNFHGSFNGEIKKIYDKYHFVGKIYHVWNAWRHRDKEGKDENYLQIYVYDYAHRNWSLQLVLDELLKMKLISKSDLKA